MKRYKLEIAVMREGNPLVSIYSIEADTEQDAEAIARRLIAKNSCATGDYKLTEEGSK